KSQGVPVAGGSAPEVCKPFTRGRGTTLANRHQRAYTLDMFGIGSGEILLILLIVFLIYGPERLPEMAQKLGKAFLHVKNASDEMKNAVHRELSQPEKKSIDESSK